MPAILLTGRPGCGKTTIVRDVVRALNVPAQTGRMAGGFYTEEVREGGHRLGFDLVTLDGRRACLASAQSRSRLRVSRYGVELEALDGVGVEAIRWATAEASVIVIDEIGKMELFSQEFRGAVLAALDSGRPVLGTVMLAPHPFADAVKARPDVQVLTVTEESRRDVGQRVLRALRQLLAGP